MNNFSLIQACMRLDKLSNWKGMEFKITFSLCKASPRQTAAGWIKSLEWWCRRVTTKHV